jgi:hypothetical protein
MVDHGVTPLNVLFDTTDPRWLRIGMRESRTVHEVFDDTITTVDIGSLYSITFDYFSQTVVFSDVDFYISVGVIVGTAESTISGSLEVIQS